METVITFRVEGVLTFTGLCNHPFMVNRWRRVLAYRVDRLRTSGLHDACRRILVGVMHENGKMSLHFSRNLADEAVIWRSPLVRSPPS